MPLEEVADLLQVEGICKMSMKNREGVLRAQYEWYFAEGQLLETEFEDDRLSKWELYRIPTAAEIEQARAAQDFARLLEEIVAGHEERGELIQQLLNLGILTRVKFNGIGVQADVGSIWYGIDFEFKENISKVLEAYYAIEYSLDTVVVDFYDYSNGQKVAGRSFLGTFRTTY